MAQGRLQTSAISLELISGTDSGGPGRIQFGSSHLWSPRGSGHGNPCNTSCMYSISLFSISKGVDYEDLRSLKVPPKAMRLKKCPIKYRGNIHLRLLNNFQNGGTVWIMIQSTYYTLVMYTYTKCYMRFCTPRRTIMDSKKKTVYISVLQFRFLPHGPRSSLRNMNLIHHANGCVRSSIPARLL